LKTQSVGLLFWRNRLAQRNEPNRLSYQFILFTWWPKQREMPKHRCQFNTTVLWQPFRVSSSF